MVKKLKIKEVFYWGAVGLIYLFFLSAAICYMSKANASEVYPGRENHVFLWVAVFIIVSWFELKDFFVEGHAHLQNKAEKHRVFQRQWKMLLLLLITFIILMPLLNWAEGLVMKFINIFI